MGLFLKGFFVAKRDGFNWVRFSIGLAVFLVVDAIIVLSLLYGGTVNPIEYAEPPAFMKDNSAPVSNEVVKEVSTGKSETDQQIQSPQASINFAELVRRVVNEGESPESLVAWFMDGDEEIRIEAAIAFSELLLSNRMEKREDIYELMQDFWGRVDGDIEIIQSALYEALVDSAEKGTFNNIPNVIAWMPRQDNETVELLAWTADHHPDVAVRSSALASVVHLEDQRSELNQSMVTNLLARRAKDPSVQIRIEVFGHRMDRRFAHIY